MSTLNDGGPALPVPTIQNANGDVQPGANGMSLRDYLAGQALIGFVVRCNNTEESAKNIGAASYAVADLILMEREKRGDV